MKKIIVIIYIIALFCLIISVFKTKDTLYEITNDFNNDVYIELGVKEYNKENILLYYKQVIRYLIYFIYYVDIFNLETVNL